MVQANSQWASVGFQGEFARQVLAHPIAARFPPAADYRRALLRPYIDAIGRLDGEYDDDLMQHYADLMQECSALVHGMSEVRAILGRPTQQKNA